MKARSRLFRILAIGAGLLALSAIPVSRTDYFEINKQLEIFTDLYREINLYYVDEQAPSELMDKAIVSMLASLDPYTNYIPESYVEDYRAQNTGQYAGVGASIRKKGAYPVISSLHQNMAADKAGLMVGDELLKVAELDLKGMSVDDVSRLLKGAPGTKVEIELQRGDKRLRKMVVREEVRVPGVPYSAEIAPGIGYIYLSQFNERASIEVRQAYESLNPDGHLTGLILDLRGNPGGLLGEAVNVSNLFIDKGQEVVRTKGKVKEADARYLPQFNPLNREIPLVVLINGNSASASEIVAGVMQDLDRGVILGQRSFGKGLVQQTKPVSYGAQLKLTIAKYYTPSGRCIQAIDYAERDASGAVKAIPDSLRNSFTTRNGRLVKDGAGIDPDEVVREEELPRVLFSLLQEDLVFDFANQLQRNAPEDSINPAVYTFPENAFKAFQQFVQAKGFTYETYTDELLKQIENSAKEERFADLLPELEKLKKAFTQIKGDDIQEHQDLVKQWLGSEMAMRYAYERGRVIYDLRYDPVSQRAIEILNNQDVYQAILDGQP